MSAVIKLAKVILGLSKPGTPPMGLRETVDAVARVSAVVYFACETLPLYVSNNKLEDRYTSIYLNW